MFRSVYAVDAPAPVVSNGSISWPAVNAESINVHNGNGDYLETLAGNASQWTPSEPGNYYLVATEGNDWRNWSRSITVSVASASSANPTESTTTTNSDQSLTEVNAIVYSQTAAELFWQSSGEPPIVTVNITRTDGMRASTNGRSFFDAMLEPGTTYGYTLTPTDSLGNTGVSTFIELTTPGGIGVPSPATQPAPVASDNGGTTPTAPSNFRASVYSTNALELFWEHASDFGVNTFNYRVSQDGQEIATTSGSSLFIDGLSQGTEFSFSIEALNSAQASSEALTITARTNGFPLITGMFGRPSEDRDTHRFYLWDRMSAEEQARWPSDCLFAVRRVNFFNDISTVGRELRAEVCFSPITRSLIHRTNFLFPLPGNNDTNHIEAVEWFHFNSIGLVTDITTEFGQSIFELSVFSQTGAFTGTFPILDSILSSDPGNQLRAINLDGKDVRATVSILDRTFGFRVNELIVIGEY